MASSLHSNFTASLFLSPKDPYLKSQYSFAAITSKTSIITPVRAGPRSNRGPLRRGRILSTEAILAIQSLKRNYKSEYPTKTVLPNLTRLIKSDLVSIIRELLRQDLCSLSLHVLSTLRSEYPDQIELNIYADIVFALLKNERWDDIDRLICDLEHGENGVQWGSDKGLARVVRGVVEGKRRESTVKIYGMMRRSGCGDTWTADEYVVKVLSRGLKAMGEGELAGEVEREFGRGGGNLEKFCYLDFLAQG